MVIKQPNDIIVNYFKFLAMKASTGILRYNYISKVILSLFSLFLSAIVFAQDAAKKIDVNINTNSGGGFFGSPWIWVVGIAVFVLLLVALLRGNGRRNA